MTAAPTITARYDGFQTALFGSGSHEYSIVQETRRGVRTLGRFSIDGDETELPDDWRVANKMKQMLAKPE